jgi:glycosyltransferase involved in cell wall biosynthesis
LDNQELRESLARSGRELVEKKYSWNAIGNTLEAFYQRIYLGRKRRSLIS